jgi:hypothetical protein
MWGIASFSQPPTPNNRPQDEDDEKLQLSASVGQPFTWIDVAKGFCFGNSL